MHHYLKFDIQHICIEIKHVEHEINLNETQRGAIYIRNWVNEDSDI